ncbi:recombinase family protein [Microbacterium lacticum]|uniref:DNA invertase Pin-like site-specific DNA recombinase n=1 Tax=Microbacterium lacticum TaxID=33885 RepID=A0A4Y3UHQ3_9MICO|nr:recombinase family protein [Microbacterium lacticum]TQN00740.1 DNA invertase Pin-like site-specific DNA recombinase [Microbacterium lacticum]GEB94176.1 resolvase-like protein [Microbacterium lacticum]GGN13866.1 resolvase-like protein [Microbacterium lacticum]
MSTKTRAVYYARVSTDMQVDNTSLPEQKEICEATIKMRGWELVGTYVDEGLSGTDASRPAWRQMLQDARDGKIDAVVVSKLDRFARKAGDAIRETDRLSEMGVDLVLVKEQIDMSTPQGKMMRTMMAGFAEMERDTIVARTAAGQRAKGRAGGWAGSKPPFGWKLEGLKREARPVRDEREREVLRAMYSLFVKERLSTAEVADRLNLMGLRPRQAATWQYQTVRQTATNPTLWTGETEWGAAMTGAYRPHRKVTKMNRDGSPKYGETVRVVLGNPVFTRQEWQALQRAVNRRAGWTPSAPQRQMLTGRLFGQCEFDKHYDGVTTKSRPNPFYICAGKRYRSKEQPRCSCTQIKGPAIDEPVWAELAAMLADPERLERLARQWLELDDDADLNDEAPMVAALRKQEATLERAMGRAKDLYLMADDPAEHRATVERLRGDLAELRERLDGLAAMRSNRAEQAQRITDVAALAERARGRLENASAAIRREVVELLDVRVIVSDIVDGRPQAITIHGVLDPSMFLPAEVSDRKPSEQARSSRSSS